MRPFVVLPASERVWRYELLSAEKDHASDKPRTSCVGLRVSSPVLHFRRVFLKGFPPSERGLVGIAFDVVGLLRVKEGLPPVVLLPVAVYVRSLAHRGR